MADIFSNFPSPAWRGDPDIGGDRGAASSVGSCALAATAGSRTTAITALNLQWNLFND